MNCNWISTNLKLRIRREETLKNKDFLRRMPSLENKEKLETGGVRG